MPVSSGGCGCILFTEGLPLLQLKAREVEELSPSTSYLLYVGTSGSYTAQQVLNEGFSE